MPSEANVEFLLTLAPQRILFWIVGFPEEKQTNLWLNNDEGFPWPMRYKL